MPNTYTVLDVIAAGVPEQLKVATYHFCEIYNMIRQENGLPKESISTSDLKCALNDGKDGMFHKSGIRSNIESQVRYLHGSDLLNIQELQDCNLQILEAIFRSIALTLEDAWNATPTEIRYARNVLDSKTKFFTDGAKTVFNARNENVGKGGYNVEPVTREFIDALAEALRVLIPPQKPVLVLVAQAKEVTKAEITTGGKKKKKIVVDRPGHAAQTTLPFGHTAVTPN